jgi:hypothetical protein
MEQFAGGPIHDCTRDEDAGLRIERQNASALKIATISKLIAKCRMSSIPGWNHIRDIKLQVHK